MAPEAYRPLERRPLASRSWSISRRAAARLALAGASPNGISIAGMAAGIASGAALASTSLLDPGWARAAWLSGALLAQLRLAANLLDGMVAVEMGRASPVGELYNEIPDRVSDAAILIGAGCAAGGHVVLGFAAACAAIFTAYVRAMGKAAGAPQDYSGPMAKQQRMFVITVAALYAGLAPPAWQPVLGPWAPAREALGLAAIALAVILAGSLITAGRRIARIAAALRAPR